MKKNTKRARLQSLDAAQLAQVAGGMNPFIQANWHLHNLSTDWDDGTGWDDFFEAASTAVASCTCAG